MRPAVFLALLVFLALDTAKARHDKSHPADNSNGLHKPRPVEKKDPDSGNANFTTDMAIKVITKTLLSEEPVELDVVGPCSKCQFNGISKMTRQGPATTTQLDGDKKRVKLAISFPLVNVSCECSVGKYIFSIYGEVDVFLSDLTVYLDVVVDLASEETDIRSIQVLHPGEIKAEFDGYGILGNIIDKCSFLYKGTMIRTIREYIYEDLPRIIRDEQRHHLYQLGYLKKK